jgi:hypothetical protein
MQPVGRGADAAGLVDRDASDEVQIDHGQDIKRQYLEQMSFDWNYARLSPDSDESDAIGRIS